MSLRPCANPLDERTLNAEHLRALQDHSQLIAALDSWGLQPDRRFLPQLHALARLVQELAPLKSVQVFRGFDLGGSQEDFGLTKALIADLNGKPFQYTDVTKQKTLVFTTERVIAECLGEVVVKTVLSADKHLFLPYTAELAFLVGRRRPEAPIWRHEVFVLPSAANFKLQVVRSPTPSWLEW